MVQSAVLLEGDRSAYGTPLKVQRWSSMFYMRLEGLLLDWSGVHTVLAFSEGLASLYTFYCLELKIYTLALTVLTECDYKHHMHSFPVFPLLCSSLSLNPSQLLPEMHTFINRFLPAMPPPHRIIAMRASYHDRLLCTLHFGAKNGSQKVPAALM